MIAGVFDARELADILDVRASTIRRLVAEDSPLIPRPVYLFNDRSMPYWPMAMITCWRSQGSPANFEYDHEEFTNVAVEQFRNANREAIEAIDANQQEVAQ